MTYIASTSNFNFGEESSINKDAFTDFQEIYSLGYNALLKANKNGKLFVLKGLKPEFRQVDIYEKALRKEYDILSTLQHPNIIAVESFEEVEGMGGEKMHCAGVCKWQEPTRCTERRNVDGDQTTGTGRTARCYRIHTQEADRPSRPEAKQHHDN